MIGLQNYHKYCNGEQLRVTKPANQSFLFQKLSPQTEIKSAWYGIKVATKSEWIMRWK